MLEQHECERKFMDLPFIAIEPFSEEVMEWDEGEASPSPLQPLAQWPRNKGRKERLNSRRLEVSDGVSLYPKTGENQVDSRQGESTQKTPEGGRREDTAASCAPIARTSGEPAPAETSIFNR